MFQRKTKRDQLCNYKSCRNYKLRNKCLCFVHTKKMQSKSNNFYSFLFLIIGCYLALNYEILHTEYKLSDFLEKYTITNFNDFNWQPMFVEASWQPLGSSIDVWQNKDTIDVVTKEIKSYFNGIQNHIGNVANMDNINTAYYFIMNTTLKEFLENVTTLIYT